MNKPTTLRELKKSGYQSRSIKEEIRENLLKKLGKGEPVFSGIFGFEDTVIPDIERALLSRHNINLLGLRGQAKTRIAREMTSLLDEYIPIVQGSELNDDPLKPLSSFAKNLLTEMGDETPIAWLHRSDRYIEKLATPDVSVADLIGDVDPIKAVNLKLNYSDERVIHFGLIPRSNRCIFVINELPDLQARIQVALFNILQEGDIQIRGFKLRLPLDIQFVFTANPEDYTNRGNIVTPLKDRIGSQILTHYPKDVETASRITLQEASITQQQKDTVETHPLLAELIEQICFEARVNEFVDPKSGVSARLSISAYENLISAAERRAVIANDRQTRVRISDLYGVIPSITGKVEMVYEGEQEGPFNVANILIGKSIRTTFGKYFPVPEESKRITDKKASDPYIRITSWFEKGNTLDLLYDISDKEYARNLNQVDGLVATLDEYMTKIGKAEKYLWMEFLLHGLAEYSKLGKVGLHRGARFKDLLGSMFSNLD
jgi:magnesium chelatase subunit I